MRVRSLAVAVAVTAALAAGTWIAVIPPALAAGVTIADNSYAPTQTIINPGDGVTWTYVSGNRTHTATSDDGTSFSSGNLTPGNSFSHTFNAVGTFAYHCNFHSSMHGTVYVGTQPP